MPLIEYLVQGYDSFIEKVTSLENISSAHPIIVLFCGCDGKNYWCKECIEFDETMLDQLRKVDKDGTLIRVKIGSLEQWKKITNPFANDSRILLRNLPTAMRWGTSKKLSGDDIKSLENLLLLFEDDDDE